MQQIQNALQDKKTSASGSLFMCNPKMVRQVDSRWNQVYPSLMLMYEKLVKFGLALDRRA